MAQESLAAKAAGTAASSTAAASSTTTTGIVSTVLSSAKAAVVSPVFGIVVLAGIIGFELWKGNRDANKFETGN
ncbi:MAG: hypothetical protein GY795_27285 [Desulfobacterales bacterium]|nr:hypothetical protein [Desulfobacterales bacterium]